MSFKSSHGYSVLLPLAFAGLCLGFVSFIITGIYTGDWRWLLAAFACYAVIAAK